MQQYEIYYRQKKDGIHMNIDERDLTLFYPRGVQLRPDERFYNVPGATGYGLSNYGRLCHRYIDSYGKPKTNIEKVIYTSDTMYNEAYNIKFDTDTDTHPVSIFELLKLVFMPDYTGHIGFKQLDCYNSDRYILQNIILLQDKKDYVEYILSKTNHREFNLPREKINNSLINQIFEGQRLYKKMRVSYHATKMRATNQKMKDRRPEYADSVMCEDWLHNPNAFYDWYMQHLYYYPGDKLVVDKDLLNFGETKIYSPDCAALIPESVNRLIARDSVKVEFGYNIQQQTRKNGKIIYTIRPDKYPLAGRYSIICDRYSDALIAGRQKRAKHIRCFAELERQKGYLPQVYIDKLIAWANRCELGLIKIYEPSKDVIDKLA